MSPVSALELGLIATATVIGASVTALCAACWILTRADVDLPDAGGDLPALLGPAVTS